MLKRIYPDDIAPEPAPTFSNDDLFSQPPSQPELSSSSVYETITDRTVAYQLITTAEERHHLADLLTQESEICIDLETTFRRKRSRDRWNRLFQLKPITAGLYHCPPILLMHMKALNLFCPCSKTSPLQKSGKI